MHTTKSFVSGRHRLTSRNDASIQLAMTEFIPDIRIGRKICRDRADKEGNAALAHGVLKIGGPAADVLPAAGDGGVARASPTSSRDYRPAVAKAD